MSDRRLPDPAVPVDLLVVGAGPTGLAIGAEARREGLDVVLLDRGPLQAGYDLGRIFIENSREHGVRIVRHLRRRLRPEAGEA